MELRELIDKLNKYRDSYYNKNESLISDKEYDDLFDKLIELEKSTGIIFPDSPSQTVGFEVQSELEKVEHDHSMLSLDKTKDLNTLLKFCNDKRVDLMLKMDGCTVTLHYDNNGDLVLAATRGGGVFGENVTKNVLCISNVPKHINNNGIPYVIDGEIIMTYSTFENVNNKLPEAQQYSHPRNLASGSLRQLDTRITASRDLKFIAWRVIEGDNSNSFSERILNAQKLGFTIVPTILDHKFSSIEGLQFNIDQLKNTAKEKSYPIDGMVVTFEDINYGENLGKTLHHPLHSLALKFYDEGYETELINIEWNTTRTGMISPVAVFKEVDLEGALTSRATLHNISYIKEVLGNPYKGQKIYVARMNQVIPKVIQADKDEDGNIADRYYISIPELCPSCGGKAEIRKDGIAEFLYCTNPSCLSKILSQFIHFCDKGALDIEGLSDATIETFINLGLLNKYSDIFHLKDHKEEIIHIDGFGEKSFNKLCKAIEKAKSIKFENYLVAIGINGIGKATARTISNKFNTVDNFINNLKNQYDLTTLNDFGESTAEAVYNWYNNVFNTGLEEGLLDELTFINEEKEEVNINNFINGKTFVVTGAFNSMKRPELEKFITNNGGKLAGSVSKKTNYLLTNETTATTKYMKAQELNIPIINEAEFFEKVNFV